MNVCGVPKQSYYFGAYTMLDLMDVHLARVRKLNAWVRAKTDKEILEFMAGTPERAALYFTDKPDHDFRLQFVHAELKKRGLQWPPKQDTET